MKKKFLVLVPIVIIAIIVAVIYFRDADKIIVGVDNNPPYTFFNQAVSVGLDKNGVATPPVVKNGAYAGFDIDVIEAAAKIAGLKIEYRDITFGKMLEQIEQGKQRAKMFAKSYYAPSPEIDIAVGGISVTDERKKSVDFTTPYAKGGACIVTLQGSNIANANDLPGKTVGVELSTTMVKQAAAVNDAKLKGYHNQQEMYIDLYDGELDAIIMDKLSAEYCVKERKMKKLKIVNMLSSEEFAMVLRKGDNNLLDKLNRALVELEKNGELKKIYDKWFAKQ
ncbi:MAG: ABC transporter substrate-binding protein [Negativicutes bacterium]|jgi:ABC-type amino acid transport substrate-binding protein